MVNSIYQILSESAWYEGRKKDVTSVIDDLKREELTLPNEAILKILEEFEYVELNFKTPDGLFSNILFNVENAIDNLSLKLLNKYERLINEKLVAIGTINFDTAILFMSYSSKFFMVHEGGFFLVGNSFEEMLDTVIYQKDIYRVG